MGKGTRQWELRRQRRRREKRLKEQRRAASLARGESPTMPARKAAGPKRVKVEAGSE